MTNRTQETQTTQFLEQKYERVMTACVPFYRHYRTGKVIKASDYGKKCFPIYKKVPIME